MIAYRGVCSLAAATRIPRWPIACHHFGCCPGHTASGWPASMGDSEFPGLATPFEPPPLLWLRSRTELVQPAVGWAAVRCRPTAPCRGRRFPRRLLAQGHHFKLPLSLAASRKMRKHSVWSRSFSPIGHVEVSPEDARW